MNLYLAAAFVSHYHKSGSLCAQLLPSERVYRDAYPFWLESYHYFTDNLVANIRRDKEQVFLDSGAFSAKTMGVEINLNEYIRFIHENRDLVRIEDGLLLASVLDGIGDPKKTWENQMEMERQGIRPLPCFHYGEPDEYLCWYLERYSYITIGGLVRLGQDQQALWLDRIWKKYLAGPDGRPRVKVHGFGLTSGAMMWRYPWYSVDSSSWIQVASFGHIQLPELGILPISKHSPHRKEAWKHFDRLPDLQRQKLTELFTSKGFSVERLADSYLVRRAFNCWSYPEEGRLHSTDRIQSNQQWLF